MVFDYSVVMDDGQELGMLIDDLSLKQAEEVKRYIMEMRLRDEQGVRHNYKEWLENAVIGGLRCFAETTTSRLEIHSYETEIDVLLQNKLGFNTQNENTLQYLKIAITAADYVAIEVKEEIVQMNLVYDLAKIGQKNSNNIEQNLIMAVDGM